VYKDRSSAEPDVTEPEPKKSEFVNLDELSESTVQNRDSEDKENADPQVEHGTPTTAVRRSSRNIIPPHRF